MACAKILILASCCTALIGSPPLAARDLGNYGEIFPVTEPDFLATLTNRLKAMQANGGLARMEKEMQDKTRSYANRPRASKTYPCASEARSFTVDLSITVAHDLSDQNGTVFASAGTVVNPLAYSHFDKKIVFIDGDDPEQVAWATAEGDELNSLIVMVQGAPLELMRKHGRRFWFDQDGIMAAKFQIAKLPSRVTRADPFMRVEEIVLKPKGDK
jgi:conjugal transfer pilus assembly protein TraW